MNMQYHITSQLPTFLRRRLLSTPLLRTGRHCHTIIDVLRLVHRSPVGGPDWYNMRLRYHCLPTGDRFSARLRMPRDELLKGLVFRRPLNRTDARRLFAMINWSQNDCLASRSAGMLGLSNSTSARLVREAEKKIEIDKTFRAEYESLVAEFKQLKQTNLYVHNH